MAKQYFQGNSGFKMLVDKNRDLDVQFKKLQDYRLNLYLETTDGKMTSGIVVLKLVSPDPATFNGIASILSGNKNTKMVVGKVNNEIDFTMPGLKLRLYKSGGKLTNVIDDEGNALTNKSPSTAQQEDAIRYMLEYLSLYGSIPSKDQINKECKFEFGKDWHESFIKTTDAVFSKIQNMKRYNFYRDSNKKKPAFLNQMTDEKILPDSKDNWNPADIWLIDKSKEHELHTEISIMYKNIIEGKSGIEDLNKFIEIQFDNLVIIGISLKKVSGSKASIHKIKFDSKITDSIKLKGPSGKFKFNTENSYFDVLINMDSYDSTVPYRFRFRPKGASGELKTYGEGQPQDAKVFDGAISSELIRKLYPTIEPWVKFVSSKMVTSANVYDTILSQSTDIKFVDFIKAEKFKMFEVEGLNKDLGNEYKVKRACVLLYYIWQFETCDQSSDFKQMYMAAKKMNSFSSVHYKVY